MPTNSAGDPRAKRWLRLTTELKVAAPHLSVWLEDEAQFIELRLKGRDDGTTLAIGKGYGSDGTPMVCFGVGLGAVMALLAIDATMAGNNWRPDKPWKPGK